MNAVQKAINHFGTVVNLAKKLDVSPQAVCFWRDDKRKLSADIAIKIEVATNRAVTCEELRPDVNWAAVRKEVRK